MAHPGGSKVIIRCAVTGAIHTPSTSDALPITPEQIAQSSVEAADRLEEPSSMTATPDEARNVPRLDGADQVGF